MSSSVPLFEKHYVYGMLCRDGDGPLYIKFGRTKNLAGRLTALMTASPIPAQWFVYLEVPLFRQKAAEKQLHWQFRERKVTGEWFKFDADTDKREFNDGCRLAFLAALGKSESWTKLSVPQLKAENKARSTRFMKTKSDAFRKRMRRRRADAKELQEYGIKPQS